MRPTRTVLPALLVAVLLSGCGGGDPTPAPTSEKDKGTGKPDKTDKTGTTPPANVKEVEAAAKSFATTFLTAVRDKKATPDQLTPEFKKVFAPAGMEAEKAQGYSDTVATAELSFLAGEVGADDVTVVGNADGSAFAVGKNKANGSRTLLRVVKVGADLKVDWLSVGPSGVPDATLTGENAPAQFAAQALLDAVNRNKTTLAPALLTDAARSKYGESVITKAFDAGALRDNLRVLLGFDKYAVTAASNGSVTVELAFAAGKKTGTLKAVKGPRPGEWLVDSIEVK